MKPQRRVLLSLSSYLVDIHRGVARYAKERGWLLHADMAFDAELPWGWQGDGVITLLGAEPEEVRFALQMKCPVVDLALSRAEIPLPRVSVDNAAVARLAAEHFRERGFRNFAYYGRYGLGVDLRRRQCFQESLAAQGFGVTVMGWERERGRQPDTWTVRRQWLARRLRPLPKPLAVFTSRDKDGAELIEVALAAGMHVPEEVAVLGVNNSELVCDFLPVPLSSIDVGWERIGYEGAALLDRLMRGEAPPPEPILLPPVGLVTRHSTDILAVENLDVARALRHIWLHYAEAGLGVPQVAAAVGMSRSRLDKAFHRCLQRNVGAEIRLLRLRRVKELLQNSHLTLEAIGRAAGFATQPHFYRAFREAEGLTPHAYRLHQRRERRASEPAKPRARGESAAKG